MQTVSRVARTTATTGNFSLYLAVLSFVACAILAFVRPYPSWEWIPAICGLGVFGFLAARRFDRRPYPNTGPALTLTLMIPGYHVIAMVNRDGRELAMPALAIDRALPVEPAWMLAYGSIWLFAFLPVSIVRGAELTRRALHAFIAVVGVAYACFLLYPTVLPRPASVGEGFFAWTLALNYAADPPLNCFPSLHVAWGFVAAFACHRVHRGVGLAAFAWAGLIAISTLYTKQHYVVDVLAGIAIAAIAYVVFLRGHSRESVEEADWRRAPERALRVAGIYAVTIALFWIGYRLAG